VKLDAESAQKRLDELDKLEKKRHELDKLEKKLDKLEKQCAWTNSWWGYITGKLFELI
jgi:tetrahydromethanopterin S-methyltransferase subunit G